MTIKHLINALKIYYSEDPWPIFKQFRNGALAFGGGLMLIFYANSALSPSLQQEIMVLCGMLLGGAGFVVAIMAQVRLLISRIIRFITLRKA